MGRKNRKGSDGSRESFKFLERFREDKIEKLLRYGIILILPLIILTPEIRLTTPAIRLDEILLFVLAIIFAVYLLKTRRMKLSVIDYIFGALFVSVLISIFINSISQNYFHLNDLFEMVKLVKYYLLYSIIFNLEWQKEEIKIIVKTAIISFAVALAFSFVQYFDLFGINSSIMPLLTKPVHVRAIVVAGRVIGTFKNANSWALVLGIPLFITFAALLKRAEFKKKTHIFPWLVFLFSIFTSIIMTMGRTSSAANFLALFGISSCLLLFPYEKVGRPRIAKDIFKVFAVFVITAGLAFYFVNNIPNKKGSLNFIERFEAGIQEMGYLEEGTVEGNFQSWSSRKEKWKDVVEKSLESPIFGFGPSKSTKSSSALPYVVDNEYLLYLYRYGLLGLSLYASLFFVFLFYGAMNLKNTLLKKDKGFVVNVVALGIAISYPLYNLLAGSFYDFQLFPLFIFWGALNLNILEKNER